MFGSLLIAFIFGAICASIAWVFIWRNNKKKVNDALNDLDTAIKYAESENDLKTKVKNIINVFK